MNVGFGSADIKSEGDIVFTIDDVKIINGKFRTEIWSKDGEVFYGILHPNASESEILLVCSSYRKTSLSTQETDAKYADDTGW